MAIAVEGDEDPGALVGVEADPGVEERGVPVVAEDPSTAAILLQEAEGRAGSFGQGAEGVGVQAGSAHQVEGLGGQRARPLTVLEKGEHEAGHVHGRGGQGPGGRRGAALEPRRA